MLTEKDNWRKEYHTEVYSISRDEVLELARRDYERLNAMSKEQLIEIIMGKERYLNSKMPC